MHSVKFTIIISLIIFVFVSLFNFIVSSDVFYVDSLNIHGAQSHSDEEIISSISRYSVIDNNLLAQLNINNLLFWLLSDEDIFLDDSIFPSIKDVVISADILNKNVDIALNEKKVFGVLCNDNDCFVFDDNGVIFKKSPQVKGTIIPKINDPYNRPIIIGLPFLKDKSWFSEIFEAVEAAESLDLSVADISLRSPELREWELHISNGPDLYFSFGNLPNDIEKVLVALKQKVNIDSIQYADFRIDGRIYYQ